MASGDETAGPSRPKRNKFNNNVCGLDQNEIQTIMKVVGDDDFYVDRVSDDEEEPYIESGSEYELESDISESSDEGISSSDVEEDTNETADKKTKLKNDTHPENNEEFLEMVEIDRSDINISWTNNNFQPKVHQFDDTACGMQGGTLDQNSKEIDFFLEIFTEEMAELIITETNCYAHQQNAQKWKDLNLAEFQIFISLTMLMSRNKKLDIKEYWSKDVLLSSPIFSKQMPRDRYLQIKRYLHFANNENAPSNNRLYKIEKLLQKCKTRLQTSFHPFQNLVIDESMILFKGRLSFKQYIKTKRHRFGIKLYVLCDCETGIVLDFVVYIGKQTSIQVKEVKGLGSSGSIVATLMEPYINKGHTLFTDNYYSSPILSTYLFEKKTNSCGTVRANRKHMPLLKNKLQKGETDWRTSENLLVIKWKDRRDVSMITSMHENTLVTSDKLDRITNRPIEKPLCVVKYNERMGAVDRTDMMISSIACMRKSTKWYKKLFIHVLDISLLNAHAMFLTKVPVKVPLAKFQLNLIQQLLERNHTTRNTIPSRIQELDATRLTGRHFPAVVPATAKSKNPSRRCLVCAQTKKGQKKRKESRYMCCECNVGLCIFPCFKTYHTIANF